MIAVDLSQLEQLSDLIFKISNNTDDLLSHKRELLSEIEDDSEFATYPQCASIIDLISGSVDMISQLNESVQSLKNVIAASVEEYKENEKKFTEALTDMLGTLNGLQVNLASATAADLVAVEKDIGEVSKNEVQKLVAESSTEMELINIAAVKAAVDEELCVAEVKSNSKLVKDIADAEEETEDADFRAAAIKIEDEEDDDIEQNKKLRQMASQFEDVEASVIMAENIRVKDAEDNE